MERECFIEIVRFELSIGECTLKDIGLAQSRQGWYRRAQRWERGGQPRDWTGSLSWEPLFPFFSGQSGCFVKNRGVQSLLVWTGLVSGSRKLFELELGGKAQVRFLRLLSAKYFIFMSCF